jgi:hypothetical protein
MAEDSAQQRRLGPFVTGGAHRARISARRNFALSILRFAFSIRDREMKNEKLRMENSK